MTNMKKARKKAHITQQEMADTLCIGRDTYIYYESGKRPIPSDKLIHIATILNESTDYLLEMSGSTRKDIDEKLQKVEDSLHSALKIVSEL